MAEENTPDTKPESTTAPELSAIELRAMETGWVPEDQWEGDPELWRPAKEYVDRGELFKKIDDQNRTIKDFKRALDDLKGHHAKVRETEYARALVALKEQKKTALEDGDAAGVIKIDDQIDLVKEEQKRLAMPQTQQTTEAAPEFTNWVARNKWYDTSEPMRAYADSLGRKLAAAGTSTEEVLREVERQVKQEFPHKFVNPNRGKASAVEGSSPKGGKSADSFALSDDERRVMQRFVRSGVMTEQQYIKDLKSVRGE